MKHRRGKGSFSPDAFAKINGPELDFDDMESINQDIPQARKIELVRLREENAELKDKLM